MINYQVLQNIWLSEREAKIYTSLLVNGIKNISEISKDTWINRRSSGRAAPGVWVVGSKAAPIAEERGCRDFISDDRSNNQAPGTGEWRGIEQTSHKEIRTIPSERAVADGFQGWVPAPAKRQVLSAVDTGRSQPICGGGIRTRPPRPKVSPNLSREVF